MSPAPTPWSLARGATLLAGGSAARFSVWCPPPAARGVEVVIEGGPAAGRYALEPLDGGVFELVVDGVAAGTRYAYSLDGGAPRPDPVSRWQPDGVHSPSCVVDPGAFTWRDAGWTGIAMSDYVIYELHVGTFTRAGTFDAVIQELGTLAHLGVSAIELMPVAQFSGGRNWGYDGVNLYAPQNSYGGPDGLKRLIDAAHEHELAVVLDVVYNHLGPEGNYLGEFGPYFTDAYHIPWGAAINYDGPGSEEVRRYVIDNARHWIAEYHVDALRLDAVHGIHDSSERHILEELARDVQAESREVGRRVQLMAESDLNDPRLVQPVESGGYALDAQWSDDFHHAIHVALTGESAGYYADYSGVRDIAAALERRFVYTGQYSTYRGRHHGAPAAQLPTSRFVVAVQNHDQVGNRANGERLSLLVSDEKLKLAAALLLLSPYVPLIFMGEEYGETHPFLYFVSHGDPALAVSVRQGRRRDFESFGWPPPPELPDPQSIESFERSILDRHALDEPRHRQLFALYRDLLGIRRSELALRPGAVDVHAEAGPEGEWLLVRLQPRQPDAGGRDAGGRDARALLALYNFSAREHNVLVGAGAGRWRLRFSTRNARYGGPSDSPRITARRGDAGPRITLRPESAVLYRDEER